MGWQTDVLVIGGGPAGLAAAIAARKKGFAVTVADGAAPPIDKACGEGLMPNTLAALRELGVAIHADDGRTFRGVRFIDGTTSVEANFLGVSGFGVRRTVLHQKMIRRAQECGVTLLWKTPVSGLTEGGANLGGKVMTAKWIIGADGIHSRVRRWSGLGSNSWQEIRFAQRRHYRVKPWADCMEIHWGQKMQAYVTPLRNDETCVVLISRRQHLCFEEALREFPRLSSSLLSAELTSNERGAVTAIRKLKRVYLGNIALTGDASGSVDAITGAGLCLSFLQAIALADAMEEGELASYQTVHRRLARWPNLMGHLLLLLDRSVPLRRRMLEVLVRDPKLFARLLAVHVGETSSMHIAATGMRLGLQFLTA